MYKRERKKIFPRFLFNPKILALLGLIIIILLSFPIAKNLSKRYTINNELKELEEEIKSIEDKNVKLSRFIDYLNSQQYLEEQARLNFGLKKEGEEVAIIDKGLQATSTEGDNLKNSLTKEVFNIRGMNKAEPAKPITNPQRWWRYFFNK